MAGVAQRVRRAGAGSRGVGEVGGGVGKELRITFGKFGLAKRALLSENC